MENITTNDNNLLVQLKDILFKLYNTKDFELKLSSLAGSGGLSSEMNRLSIKLPLKELSYVVKSTKPNDMVNGKFLGKAREALFYKDLYSQLKEEGLATVDIIYSVGDMEKCDKIIIMEDLTDFAIQSGYLYNNHSPHNWNKDLNSIISKSPFKPTIYESILSAWLMAAKFHRHYWNSKTLIEYDYLKGSSWYQGKDKDVWYESQNMVKNCWTEIKENIKNNKSNFEWNKDLIEIVEASISKIDWDDYQREIKFKPFTLIHGDFHPANLLWSWKNFVRGETIILDWEQVGIGIAGQDLGQFMISHVEPSIWRDKENDLLEKYYSELTENRKDIEDTYSKKDLYFDYINGGSRRFIWLLILLVYYFPKEMSKYFHDQVLAFCFDHSINKENVGMPLS